jgi:hypothetical protein
MRYIYLKKSNFLGLKIMVCLGRKTPKGNSKAKRNKDGFLPPRRKKRKNA